MFCRVNDIYTICSVPIETLRKFMLMLCSVHLPRS